MKRIHRPLTETYFTREIFYRRWLIARRAKKFVLSYQTTNPPLGKIGRIVTAGSEASVSMDISLKKKIIYFRSIAKIKTQSIEN